MHQSANGERFPDRVGYELHLSFRELGKHGQRNDFWHKSAPRREKRRRNIEVPIGLLEMNRDWVVDTASDPLLFEQPDEFLPLPDPDWIDVVNMPGVGGFKRSDTSSNP